MVERERPIAVHKSAINDDEAARTFVPSVLSCRFVVWQIMLPIRVRESGQDAHVLPSTEVC